LFAQPSVIERGLYLSFLFSLGVWSQSASGDLPIVDFRYANRNSLTPIGIKDGIRKSLVMPDGTLLVDERPLEFRILSVDGHQPTLDANWRQDLEEDFLPIVRTRGTCEELQIRKTAFSAETFAGPCDVFQVEILNPKPVAQKVFCSVRFGTGSAKSTERGLILENSEGVRAYLMKDWAVSVSEMSVESYRPTLGEVGWHGVLPKWSASLDGLNPAFYDAAIGWYGRPIQYRFPCKPNRIYTVVIGLCEGYWEKPGNRLLDLLVEGDSPVKIDPAEISGKDKPVTVQFLAQDMNADNWVDIVCAANEKSPHQEAFVNAIWVFEGRPDVEELGTALITGKDGVSILYQVACGSPDMRKSGGSAGILRMVIPPAGRGSITMLVPWETPDNVDFAQINPKGLLEQVRSGWHLLLDQGVYISVPDRTVVDCYRACLAQLFLLQDCLFGEGERRKRSSSVREQAYISAALSLSGYGWAARESLEALRNRQNSDGGWIHSEPGWDSAGQVIWALWLEGTVSRSDPYLRSIYPTVSKACEWIVQNREKEKERFYSSPPRNDSRFGLLPGRPTIGNATQEYHYGYDFWAIQALNLGMEIAARIGETEDTRRWELRYRRYHGDLSRSIRRVFVSDKGFLPSSPDASDTTGILDNLNAIYPLDTFSDLPELVATLNWIDRNKQEDLFIDPGSRPQSIDLSRSSDVAGCFMTLERWDRSPEVLYALLNHAQRTKTWPEQVAPDTRQGYGEMPDAETAAGYVLLFRQSLLWEQKNKLHLAAGIHRSWLNPGCTVSIADAPSQFGVISFYLQRLSWDILFGSITIPELDHPIQVHLHLRLPADSVVEEAILNGQRVPVRNETIAFFSSGGIYDVHADIRSAQPSQ